MTAPAVRVKVAPVAPPPRKRRSALLPVLITVGICLILGSVAGIVLDRLTDPRLKIVAQDAQKTVETVLKDDYGLTDVSGTTCPGPESKVGATFTCTAKTGAVPSGQVTVTVTVLNKAAQLSVGAPQ